MLAPIIAPWLSRRGIHYGWVVTIVGFFTTLMTAGAVSLPGVLILPLSKEFGWANAEISGAIAIRFVLFGLMAPFAAALMVRYGMRRIVLVALVLLIAGLAASTQMTQLWQLTALWGVTVGTATGMTALVFGAMISNRWFTARRGLVLGVLTASTASGQLVFLPLAASLITRLGWRAALVPSIAGLTIAAAAIALLMADQPADVGLAPLGDTAVKRLPTGPAAAPLWSAFSILGEASRASAFWLLAGTFLVCGFSTFGVVQSHFISFCADYGMPAVDAAAVLAMMGIFDFFGTILSGYLSDRFDNRWLLFWYYGLRGLSLFILPNSTFSILGLSVFAAFYGLDWIATVPPTVRLAGRIFGRERAPVLFGWIFAAHQLGAAIGAFGAGVTRTDWSTYVPAFYAAGAVCLAAAVAALAVRKPGEPAAPVAATAAA